MKKNTLTNAILIILLSITLVTVIAMVLLGENGLINQEKEKYNNTHVEELQEKQGNNVLVINNN